MVFDRLLILVREAFPEDPTAHVACMAICGVTLWGVCALSFNAVCVLVRGWPVEKTK